MLLSDSRASFKGFPSAGGLRHNKRCLRAPLQHRQRGLRVQADARDPPDTPKDGRKGGREWLQMLLSRFGPIRQAPENAHVLDFEKPLVELDNRIKEVKTVAEVNNVDVSEAVKDLEVRAEQLRRETYTRLTPVQRLQVARHPNRPTFLDIALNISDKFVELHGDRAGLDDPALACGLASINGESFMFIGHQKGRNTKENIYRNFGMPQPNGYRKALRFMKHADKFGFPIITFVDTPGAFAGKNAEDLGQGEAIAMNLREMFGLRVPIISVVIGEGGSGGALAIGCANRNLIMENSVYYVASPEACAAILWRSRADAALATEALKITAPDLVRFGVFDHIIPEPLGGAHRDPMLAFPEIKKALMDVWAEYKVMSEHEIKLDRHAKFRNLGQVSEDLVMGGKMKEAQAERQQVFEEGGGTYTKAGTWTIHENEAAMIEAEADADEAWEEALREKAEWTLKPTPSPITTPSKALKAKMDQQGIDFEAWRADKEAFGLADEDLFTHLIDCEDDLEALEESLIKAGVDVDKWVEGTQPLVDALREAGVDPEKWAQGLEDCRLEEGSSGNGAASSNGSHHLEREAAHAE